MTILDKIVATKRSEIEQAVAARPIAELRAQLADAPPVCTASVSRPLPEIAESYHHFSAAELQEVKALIVKEALANGRLTTRGSPEVRAPLHAVHDWVASRINSGTSPATEEPKSGPTRPSTTPARPACRWSWP